MKHPVTTLLLNGRHLSVTTSEAAILKPLVEELEALAGLPFEKDRQAWQPPPPSHVLTPSRIRGLIGRRLASLPRLRALSLEFRLIAALTINGRYLSELET